MNCKFFFPRWYAGTLVRLVIYVFQFLQSCPFLFYLLYNYNYIIDNNIDTINPSSSPFSIFVSDQATKRPSVPASNVQIMHKSLLLCKKSTKTLGGFKKTRYQPDETIRLEVRVEDETVWLSQAQMADLFGTKRPAITKHLNNIYKCGELKENSTCSILEHMGNDGKRLLYDEVLQS